MCHTAPSAHVPLVPGKEDDFYLAMPVLSPEIDSTSDWSCLSVDQSFDNQSPDSQSPANQSPGSQCQRATSTQSSTYSTSDSVTLPTSGRSSVTHCESLKLPTIPAENTDMVIMNEYQDPLHTLLSMQLQQTYKQISLDSNRQFLMQLIGGLHANLALAGDVPI